MDKSYYQQYEPVFGSWHIKKLLGEGSFGQVYEIERNEMGITYQAALKAITIPQSQNEVRSIMADGMTKDEVTTYYRGIVQDLISEIVLMSKLKGNSNIVSYEDHILKEHENGVGWDILIRMELLTPLYDYVLQNKMTKREIIQLGIDICKALELCQKYNIIHRDVKPENIFVSAAGDFKLGDFGIAKMVEKTSSGLSRKGTYTYMAPEIYRGDQYGSTVDLYSLGIVMYRLLNNNRTPFLPPYPQPITHNDKEGALLKRISGKELPEPVNAAGRLAEIVLKACAFDPGQRYTSAMQMRMELEAILYDKDEAELVYPDGEISSMGSDRYATETQTAMEVSLAGMNEPTASIFSNEETEKTDILLGKAVLKNMGTEDDVTASILDEDFVGFDNPELTDNPPTILETPVERSNQREDVSPSQDLKTAGKVPACSSKRGNLKKIIPIVAIAAIILVAAVMLLTGKSVTDIDGVDETATPETELNADGDDGTVYRFTCDAGKKNADYHVYLNGPDGEAHTSDDIDWSARSGKLKAYSPCGDPHEASTKEEFPEGYMYKVDSEGNNTGRPIDVIVWTEGGKNTHCTKELDRNKWEIERL